MCQIIKIDDKKFEIWIPYSALEAALHKMTRNLCQKLYSENHKDVVFVCVMNGAMLFANKVLSDVHMQVFNLNRYTSVIDCIKVSSYEGINSLGKVTKLVGLTADIKDKTVVILEDIVDTGGTINKIVDMLLPLYPQDIIVATMFYNESKYKENYWATPIEFSAFQLDKQAPFIVGFGLDYNGKGRHLQSIYKHVCENV